jgi:hypothetical protein
MAKAAPTVCLFLAVALIALTFVVDVGNAAPVFFGAGALMLIAGVLYFRAAIRRLQANADSRPFALGTLAILNLSRRPGRSLAVVALLACGCFLVFAVSSMQEDKRAHADERTSGTGGFALIADATFPLLEDPTSELDDSVSATAIKVRDGDDASCLNLNQAQTPRILGVNAGEMAERGAFVGEDDEIWSLLDLELPGGEVPALVGDSNTALWMLKKKVGVEKGDCADLQRRSRQRNSGKTRGQSAAAADRFPRQPAHLAERLHAPVSRGRRSSHVPVRRAAGAKRRNHFNAEPPIRTLRSEYNPRGRSRARILCR